MPVPFLACMAATAAFYALPPRVLPSIHVVEGGVPGSVHRNANGTEDLGVMQINTLWVDPIARVTRMAPQAVRARLIADPCFNIAASGAVMRTYLHEAGGNLMTAVGFYHSHTPLLGRDYGEMVTSAARKLFDTRPAAAATMVRIGPADGNYQRNVYASAGRSAP